MKDGGDDWQKKYEKEHNDFEAYKNDVTAKETKRTKEHAVREFLKGAGVSEKRLDAVLKVTNLDDFELDKDGKIKDADKHTETVKKEWADFIETTTTKGANTANYKEALLVGYLRVILLYNDPSYDAYAEALYKGAEAFTGMGHGARANELRALLQRDCAKTRWAKMK